jgi:gluconate 5-dehydrogenase
MQKIFNKNHFNFKNKIFLMTGASSQLGSFILKSLIDCDAKVIVLGRKFNSLMYKNENIFFYKCDLTNNNHIKKTILLIKKNFSYINGILNMANESRLGQPSSIKIQDFEKTMQINLKASFFIIQGLKTCLVKGYKNTNIKSSVINFISIYGISVPDFKIYKKAIYNNPIQYGSAKAALLHMTKYLSKTEHFDKIRINAISPGAFPVINDSFNKQIHHKKILSKIPLQRFGRPEDLIGPVFFLLSDMSDYMTGTNLVVDGGWTA